MGPGPNMTSTARPPAVAQARIKGAGIQPFLRWYVSAYGHERLRRLAEPIPPALREDLDLADTALGVLPSTWYNAAAVHAILDAMEADHTPQERDTIVREGARAIIESTLTGVYRWLFQTMMSLDRYAGSAQKLFSRYYEPGVMTKTPLGETGHLTVVEGWGAHHMMMCDFILHTAVYVYGVLGCKDFRVRRTSCVGQGGVDCRFEMTWS
jgi:hypothetical protein